jgi:GDPmannose 4,6-dehydratase
MDPFLTLKKKALIFGITGQDGVYLSRFLYRLGYTLVGIGRSPEPSLKYYKCHFYLQWDFENFELFHRNLIQYAPDEVYYLSGITTGNFDSVNDSLVEYLNFIVPAKILDDLVNAWPNSRFLYPSSREVFGSCKTYPQDESTPRSPRNSYGWAKQRMDEKVNFVRRSKGYYCCSLILYNHESPLRNPTFFTQKVVQSAVSIESGQTERLRLGDLDVRRDWTHAKDVARAMHSALTVPLTPVDFVIGSERSYSLKYFVEKTFAYLSMNYKNYVIFDESFYRKDKEMYPCANITLARTVLGWEPKKDIDYIIEEMIRFTKVKLRVMKI